MSTDVTPASEDRDVNHVGHRTQLVREATRTWIAKSIDLTGRNTLLYLRELKRGTLRLDDSDEGQLANLLAGKKVRLSNLFRDPELADDARKRCRAIRNRARHYMEERGLQTLRIAVGLASWSSDRSSRPPSAPVLLRTIDLIPQGRLADDFELRLVDEWELNPSLLHALDTDFNVTIGRGEKVASLLEGESAQPTLTSVFEELVAEARDISGIGIDPRHIVGNFTYAKAAQATTLGDAEEELIDHPLLAAIAGDPAAREEVLEKARSHSEDHPIDLIPPKNEFLILDADQSQSYAIQAGLNGADQVVIGPPGTGKSQTIANLIATLAANGKKALFVAEKRAAIDAVIRRLESVGLSDLVLDLHEGVGARKRVAQELNSALRSARNAAEHDGSHLHPALRSMRSELNAYVAALHAKRAPWEVSLFEANSSLLEDDSYRLPGFRFTRQFIEDLDRERFDALQDSLRRYALAGGLELTFNREKHWTSAYINGHIATDEDVSALSDLLRGILDVDFPATTAAISDMARLLGSDNPATVDEAQQLIAVAAGHAKWPRIFTESLPELDAESLARILERPRFGVIGRLIVGLTGGPDGEYKNAMREIRASMKDPKSVGAGQLPSALRQSQEFLAQWKRKSHLDPFSTPAVDHKAIKESLNSLVDRLGRFGSAVGKPELASGNFDDLLTKLNGHQSEISDLYRFPELSRQRRKLRDDGLGDFLDALEAGQVRDVSVTRYLKRAWLEGITDRISRDDQRISTFSRQAQDTIVEGFKSFDREHIGSGAKRVRRAWAERVVAAREAYPEESAVVAHQASLQRRHMPVRDLLAKAPRVMSAIKPCWVMSPLVVADLLHPKANFDVVIFDEASQVTPEDAVLSILQARQTIVAGDPKQLPPTSFFTSSASAGDDEEDEDGDTDEDLQSARDSALTEDIESILDVVGALLHTGAGTRNLDWHYRSQDEKLIAFSNAQESLYDWSLTTFPGAGGYDPISFVPVTSEPGYTGPLASNSNEVREVVQLILDHAETRPGESLGVIALGSPHANRIQESLREARLLRADLDEFFVEDGAEPFFVKNIERVQGDERDAIILTTGYSKNRDGRMRYNFGAINNEGGERRLNVAVTRAKKRVTVVSSFSGKDMDPNRLNREGPRLLKAYLDYAESKGTDLGSRLTDKPPLNAFERDVRDRLSARGLNLTTQHGASGYLIDFVAWHPDRPGQPVLAIEADGASYHSSQSARDRDRLRQDHLERLGWTFHRIWSTEWFRNRDAEIDLAVEAFERAVRIADGHETPDNPASDHVEDGTEDVYRSRQRPSIHSGEPITSYSHHHLIEIAKWVESDGLLRTEEELFAEIVKELGYGRRGSRIVEAVTRAIRAVRRDG